MIRANAALCLALFVSSVQADTPCSFQTWDTYHGTQLLRLQPGGPYIFITAEVKVDADGAPNAYHPDDVGLNCGTATGFKGLDCPANGGYPHQSWWRSAIVPDPQDQSRGYVQPDGTFKGYFVSQTSLQDKSRSAVDPQKYVDATSVPYLVFPGNFYAMTGTGSLGDYGFALNLVSGKTSPFIVAEVGPASAALGEMSIALASALGGTDPNPRTGKGAPSGRIAYVVFPRSKASPSWPVTPERMTTKVATLLEASGNVEELRRCANSP